MEGNTSGGHRNVKQIFTVEEPDGKVSQIYTVTRRFPSHQAQPLASPIGKIQPGASYSLLRKDLPPALKTRTTPSILRKGQKRPFTLVREAGWGPAVEGERKSPCIREPNIHSIVNTVHSASTSSGAPLRVLTQTNPDDEKRSDERVAYRAYVRLPLKPGVTPTVEREAYPLAVPELCSSTSQPLTRIVKRILVRRSVPLFQVVQPTETQEESTPESPVSNNAIPIRHAAKGVTVEPETPTESMSTLDQPIPIEPIPIGFIKSEGPEDPVRDDATPLSESTESITSGIEASTMNKDFPEATDSSAYGFTDLSDSADIMNDYLSDMSKNVHRGTGGFYMVSHESLMEVLSTCNICASAADVDLQRKGTTCEAQIKCRRTTRHDAFWDGEKCRSLGLRRSSQDAPNSQMLNPGPDIPWSLILLCVIAKIVDIPLKKLEHLCRLLFPVDNIGCKLQTASSLAISLPMIHGLTKPLLEKPMDHVKLIVVCRKLLVFLDPFSYSPLACFEYPGSKLLSTSDLSSALNIGLQRLQLLNCNKFSNVDVVHSSAAGEDSNDWKPVLVPDMELFYQEALTSLHVALWQNEVQLDIKSSRLRAVLEDITKALCFFQPGLAKVTEPEGRSCYSLVLQDLLRIHDSRYAPHINEMALLRSNLTSLTSPECRLHVETVIRELERIDVYHVLNSLYVKIISTADASYVVSISNEQPCRATQKVMNMIELYQEQELSLENALRVLLLLPVRNTPIDVIENVCSAC